MKCITAFVTIHLLVIYFTSRILNRPLILKSRNIRCVVHSKDCLFIDFQILVSHQPKIRSIIIELGKVTVNYFLSLLLRQSIEILTFINIISNNRVFAHP